MVTLVNIMGMNGWLSSFSFHVNRHSHSWDKAISDPDLETPSPRSWIWTMLHINQTNHFWDNSKLVFDLEKTHPILFKENLQKIRLSNIISTAFNQVIIMTRAIKLQGVIVTLVQGHGKVIQYISRDLYIICPKHLRFSSSCFDVRGKRCCGGWRGGGQGGNEMKTLSHPRQGWLNYSSWVIIIR